MCIRDSTYGELLKHDGIELGYEPAEEPLPPVTGDPARIKQVLLNILDNAAKYGRRGKKIELTSGVEGEYVRVSVRDHGPGFADEDLPHVKERFYKGRGKEPVSYTHLRWRNDASHDLRRSEKRAGNGAKAS